MIEKDINFMILIDYSKKIILPKYKIKMKFRKSFEYIYSSN